MKKTVYILTAVLTFGISANSFAAFTWLTANTDKSFDLPASPTKTPKLNIKPSANVTVGYDVETTVGGVAYSIGTFHGSGTMSYGTTSTDTAIYRFDNGTAGIANNSSSATKPPNAPATATTQVSWGAGWTASK